MYGFVVSLVVLGIALLVCVGSLIALVKQKVVVDGSGHVTDISIPMIGRLKTNYPSLAGLALGLALAGTVLWRYTGAPDTFPLHARIMIEDSGSRSDRPRDVFIGIVSPNHFRFENVRPNEPHLVELPIVGDVNESAGHYAVVYTVIGIDSFGNTRRVVESGSVRTSNGYTHAEFDARLQLPLRSGGTQ